MSLPETSVLDAIPGAPFPLLSTNARGLPSPTRLRKPLRPHHRAGVPRQPVGGAGAVVGGGVLLRSELRGPWGRQGVGPAQRLRRTFCAGGARGR